MAIGQKHFLEMLVRLNLAVEVFTVYNSTGRQTSRFEEMVSVDIRHVRNMDRDSILPTLLDDDGSR